MREIRLLIEVLGFEKIRSSFARARSKNRRIRECETATIEEISTHGHVLTPGRYVGAEEAADDGEPFPEKMQRLTAELHTQFAESAKLESQIRRNLANFQSPA